MKIAEFKSLEHGFICVADNSLEECTNFVRLSEYVEVEFTKLPNECVIRPQIEALETQRTELQAKTQLQLTDIDRKINELTALPQPNKDQ